MARSLFISLVLFIMTVQTCAVFVPYYPVPKEPKDYKAFAAEKVYENPYEAAPQAQSQTPPEVTEAPRPALSQVAPETTPEAPSQAPSQAPPQLAQEQPYPITASMRGLPPPNKGGEAVRIFPHGKIPHEPREPQNAEVFVNSKTNHVAVECCPGDRSRFFFNVSVPTITPFYLDPNAKVRTDIAMLILPGGGYEYLGWDKEGTDIAVWLNSIGITAYVLKYRVPVLYNEPRAYEDAQRAMSVLRHGVSKKPELGINPKRIGAIGFSAGGHIITRLVSSSVRQYSRLDVNDDVSFLPDFAMLIYGAAPEYLKVDYPMHYPKPPPTFLVITENDQCVNVDKMRETAYRLKIRNSSTVDLHIYPDGRHGYGRCTIYTESGQLEKVCEWPTLAENFIKRYVLKTMPVEEASAVIP